jgi:hypothetical protein
MSLTYSYCTPDTTIFPCLLRGPRQCPEINTNIVPSTIDSIPSEERVLNDDKRLLFFYHFQSSDTINLSDFIKKCNNLSLDDIVRYITQQSFGDIFSFNGMEVRFYQKGNSPSGVKMNITSNELKGMLQMYNLYDPNMNDDMYRPMKLINFMFVLDLLQSKQTTSRYMNFGVLIVTKKGISSYRGDMITKFPSILDFNSLIGQIIGDMVSMEENIFTNMLTRKQLDAGTQIVNPEYERYIVFFRKAETFDVIKKCSDSMTLNGFIETMKKRSHVYLFDGMTLEKYKSQYNEKISITLTQSKLRSLLQLFNYFDMSSNGRKINGGKFYAYNKDIINLADLYELLPILGDCLDFVIISRDFVYLTCKNDSGSLIELYKIILSKRTPPPPEPVSMQTGTLPGYYDVPPSYNNIHPYAKPVYEDNDKIPTPGAPPGFKKYLRMKEKYLKLKAYLQK